MSKGEAFYGWEPMWGYANLMDAAFSNGASIFSEDGKTVTINLTNGWKYGKASVSGSMRTRL